MRGKVSGLGLWKAGRSGRFSTDTVLTCVGHQRGGILSAEMFFSGFPGGAVVKNMPANAGDTGSSPGPGSSHMPRSN